MRRIIKNLNQLLDKEKIINDFSGGANPSPLLPVIFITGLPRSGTTPLAQLIIHRFRVGYMSNLIARFWAAPEAGIALVREISQDAGRITSSLDSHYGFTKGYEGHHEFGYFWRHWFDFEETHFLDHEAQAKVDINNLKKTLSAMENEWERPLFFKNTAALPLQTAFLADILPTSIFIHIKRDPLAVASSLLKGRKKYMGDANRWFSIKPKEYTSLKKKSIPEQIAGQVYYTQKEINRQIALVPDKRKINLEFTNLCQNADNEINQIGGFLKSVYPGIEERHVKLPILNPPSGRIDPEFKDQIKALLNTLERLDS